MQFHCNKDIVYRASILIRRRRDAGAAGNIYMPIIDQKKSPPERALQVLFLGLAPSRGSSGHLK